MEVITNILLGNIVHADLTRNNLTTFESVTFRPILEGMVSLNGSLSIDSSKFVLVLHHKVILKCNILFQIHLIATAVWLG